MNTDTIRRLDVWAGRAICFLFTIHRRLFERGPAAAAKPRRVLFIKLIEQGATVLAAPALTEAIARFGRENVFFLVFVENREILDILNLVPRENVLPVRHDGLVQFSRDVLKAVRKAKRLGVDATVDMELFARGSAIIAYLTGARVRVGLHRFTSEGPYRGDLMTHRVGYNPYRHMSEQYRLLVAALESDPRNIPLPKISGLGPAAPVEQFRPTLAEQAKVKDLIVSRLSVMPARLVLLNPNARDLLPLRRWPTERFIELGRTLLADDPQLHIIVTGAPSERESAGAVATQLGSRAA